MTGQQLFGTYTPGNTALHGLPLWVKVLLMVALSMLLALTRQWWVSAAALVLVLGIGVIGHLSLTSWWRAFAPLRWILGILTAYYLFTGALATGADIMLTLLTMIALSRILLTTTPLPTIIDGLLKVIAPLQKLGVPTDQFALALALMIRSIPVLFNEYTVLQHAAAARGLRPAPHRLFIPWVISAVAFAHTTGDALTARGLPEKQ